MADVIKQSARALFGRPAGSRQAQKTDDWRRDEPDRLSTLEGMSSFLPPERRSERLPSDSPLRTDIGLLPLDNF
jgi:hypothetical protein